MDGRLETSRVVWFAPLLQKGAERYSAFNRKLSEADGGEDFQKLEFQAIGLGA